MNQSLIILNSLILLVILNSCTQNIGQSVYQTPKVPTDKTTLLRIDTIAQKLFDKEDFPGMAVMIWQDGKYLFEKGYGYADIEQNIQVDPRQSLFRIGSVSKPVTAALLAKLYEEGKLDLDQDIRNYIPYFPQKAHPITTRQLAGHLAGIRHYKGFENMSKRFYPTVKEGLEIFMHDNLIHEPGSKYAYSSYGWNLVSAVLEEIGQDDFLSMMTDYVFEPLGLENMQAEIMSEALDNKVVFYQKNLARENTVAPTVDNSYKWAGGGFISSAKDVVDFAVAHLEPGYLQAKTLGELFATQYTSDGKPTNYGIGWRSGEDKKGRQWIGHSGGSVGGTTMMLVYPEQKLVVVTLVNLWQAKTGDLAFRLANQILSNKTP